MEKHIALIHGDGIGPEIVDEAVGVLDRIAGIYGHKFTYTPVLMGGIAIDETGVPLPEETIKICKASDSVLLGAVGGPKWDKGEGKMRPEAGLLGIRGALGLYANLRPAKLLKPLAGACPLKKEKTEQGLDVLIVRELIGGAYFGDKRTFTDDSGHVTAIDEMKYSDYEIERICRTAFELARKRRGFVTSVDKANVLDTSRLWREIAHKVREEYPDIAYEDMLVDNAAMQLIRNPAHFDVIVTENLFGDILSDEASMLTGSLGMLPSASLADGSFGLYEPVHGSAPDIAGKGIANPLATILAVGMMLRYSFGLMEEADAIDEAVKAVLEEGWRTADIAKKGEKTLSTQEMGAKVIEKLA